MNVENAVKQVMRGALSRLSNEYKIPVLQLRVRIFKEGENLKFDVLNGKDKVGETDLKKILNINGLDLFGKEKMVGNSMNASLSRLSSEEKIGITDINVKIYTRNQENCEPEFGLFNGLKALRILKFSEII